VAGGDAGVVAVDGGVRVEVLLGLLCDVDGVLALVVCGHDGCVVWLFLESWLGLK
jgi:hypothetical protein